MSRFDEMLAGLERVPVPDQWDDILDRSEEVDAAPVLELAPHTGARAGARVWLAAAACVLVVAAGAGLVALNRDADETDPPPATTPTTVLEATQSAAPVLACSGSELHAGSIADDATEGGSIFEITPYQELRPSVTWSWTVDDLDVQLVVPGIPWTDFVGERTEPLTDPEGTLAYMTDPTGERETVHAIVRTGMPSPCAWSEVVVAGGTEEERVAAALAAVESLRWEEVDASAVTDEASRRSQALAHAASSLVVDGAVVRVAVVEVPFDDRLVAAMGGGDRFDPVPPELTGATSYVTVVAPISDGVEPFVPQGGPYGASPEPGWGLVSVQNPPGTFDYGAISAPEDVEALLDRDLGALDWVPAVILRPS